MYFAVAVKELPALKLDIIPQHAKRVSFYGSHEQISTNYILYKLLKPKMPEDALAYMILTTSDLYPHPAWNFVFGYASYKDRVGVWSLHRYGDPEISEENFALCLLRTIKTGSHELGHVLGIRHCIGFTCIMNGSNGLDEDDVIPPWLCPACLYKLQWNTGFIVKDRYKLLAQFFQQINQQQLADFFYKSSQKVSDSNN